jgi:exosortase D (VPLPA-CTERM-specific)
LLILLAGLIVLFQGWKFFRAVLFPWAFLILMIPIPAILLNRITFPLQLLASKVASVQLELAGVPILHQGNMIVLAAMPLDVAEACSGIRSLLTLVTLAIIYGYLMEARNWVRVVLAISAVPIAVAANSLRVFGTGMLVQFGYADEAEGFYHALSGFLLFALALFMLFIVHRLISCIWKSDTAGARNVVHLEERPIGEIRMKAEPLRFGIVAVLMLSTAIVLHASKEVIPNYDPPSLIPSQIDGWRGIDEVIDRQTLDILGPGEYLVRDYENTAQPQPPVNLYIAYFPSQKAGDTIHSPDHCLPGAGWIPISREVIDLRLPDGTLFPANRYVVSKLGDRQIVLYWFQAHGRALANEYWAKYYLVSDAVRMNRSDGALVRLMTPMLDGESPNAAQERMMKLGSKFLPLLDSYIPR